MAFWELLTARIRRPKLRFAASHALLSAQILRDQIAQKVKEDANAQNCFASARRCDVLVSARKQSSASGSILDRRQQWLRKSALCRIDETSSRSRYARRIKPIRSPNFSAHSI